MYERATFLIRSIYLLHGNKSRLGRSIIFNAMKYLHRKHFVILFGLPDWQNFCEKHPSLAGKSDTSGYQHYLLLEMNHVMQVGNVEV